MFDKHAVELDWGGRKLTLETGRIARQADGAVLATYGETSVLCAVVAATSWVPRHHPQSVVERAVGRRVVFGAAVHGGRTGRRNVTDRNHEITSRSRELVDAGARDAPDVTHLVVIAVTQRERLRRVTSPWVQASVSGTCCQHDHISSPMARPMVRPLLRAGTSSGAPRWAGPPRHLLWRLSPCLLP